MCQLLRFVQLSVVYARDESFLNQQKECGIREMNLKTYIVSLEWGGTIEKCLSGDVLKIKCMEHKSVVRLAFSLRYS